MKYYQDLAYDQIHGKKGSVIFLGGFASNMHGVKATSLYEFCKRNDIAFTRFDYSGHGKSKGKLYNGNISKWLDDSTKILCNLTKGKQIVIGSSMGGWLMLLIALKYPEYIKGLIGIASAPDFTKDLHNNLSIEQKEQIVIQGYTKILSSGDYNDYYITSNLISDGEKNLILYKDSISIDLPIILLHGMNDHVVHYSKSLELAIKLSTSNVSVQLLKSADHSMNDKKSLNVLYQSILNLLEQ